MKFSIKNLYGKCDQNHRKLRIWSHLLKKFVKENFIFCAVKGEWVGGLREKREINVLCGILNVCPPYKNESNTHQVYINILFQYVGEATTKTKITNKIKLKMSICFNLHRQLNHCCIVNTSFHFFLKYIFNHTYIFLIFVII